MTRALVMLAALVGCSSGAAYSLATRSQAVCSCPCAEDAATPDSTLLDAAALDAIAADSTTLASDSPPTDARIVDWSQPWTRHTITHAGVRGADGVRLADVNGDGLPDVVSGWEEGGGVTLSLHPLDVRGAAEWPTVRLGALHPGQTGTTYITGYEDAIIADVDGDGHPDVIGACECGKVTVWFAPADPARLLDETAWVQVHLVTGSARHFMQLAFADVDGGAAGPEIVVGTRVDPAVIGYWTVPNSPRTVSAWTSTWHTIGSAGWVMSLVPRDVDHDGDLDLVVSDRTAIGTDDSLFGARWLENRGALGWVNHTIAGAGGHLGYPKFLWVGDYDGNGRAVVIETRGDDSLLAGAPYPNSVRIHRNANADWSGAWATPVELGDTANVGTVQSVAAGDLDGDGITDLALGYSYGGDMHQPAGRSLLASNLVWRRSSAAAGELPVAGTAGKKMDNTELIDMDGDGDLDIVQSDQGDAVSCPSCTPPLPTPPSEQLGVAWWENPLH